eukprot:Awhi_evm1s860
MSLEEKCKLANYVIPNDGSLVELDGAVDEFFTKYYPSFWKGHQEKFIFGAVCFSTVLFISWYFDK